MSECFKQKEMLKIVAIGAGEIGRPGTKVETTKIDREIIRLSGKKSPKVLFVPTGSKDSDLYCRIFKKHYEQRLGCRVSFLLLTKNKYSKREMEKLALGVDVIYVGGGNTLRMMQLWRRFGFDQILKRAASKGTVLCGVSAGANCWFKYSNSDSHRLEGISKNYILLKCLGFVSAVMCPHYDEEKGRQISLKKHMKNSKLVAIALGNCAALEIVGNEYCLLTSKNNAEAYRIFWSGRRYYRLPIVKDIVHQRLSNLLKKLPLT